MAEQDELYKIVGDFQKTLAESGFSSEKSVDPTKEIPIINTRIKNINYLLIAVILVIGVAFIGIVIDTILFHIENNKDNNDFLNFKYNTTENIEKIHQDINKLKINSPNLFK